MHFLPTQNIISPFFSWSSSVFAPDGHPHDSATFVNAETGISVLIHRELYAMNEFYQKLLKNNKLMEQKTSLLKIFFV